MLLPLFDRLLEKEKAVKLERARGRVRALAVGPRKDVRAVRGQEEPLPEARRALEGGGPGAAADAGPGSARKRLHNICVIKIGETATGKKSVQVFWFFAVYTTVNGTKKNVDPPILRPGSAALWRPRTPSARKNVWYARW